MVGREENKMDEKITKVKFRTDEGFECFPFISTVREIKGGSFADSLIRYGTNQDERGTYKILEKG